MRPRPGPRRAKHGLLQQASGSWLAATNAPHLGQTDSVISRFAKNRMIKFQFISPNVSLSGHMDILQKPMII